MNDLIDARTPRQEPTPQGRATDAAPLFVRVNHGRWIVDCPACPGAELANPNDPWFWCHGCYNQRHEYKLLPVVWPSPDDMQAIVTELRVRPVENRNWDTWEKVDVLRADNLVHLAELRERRKALDEEIKRREKGGAR